MGAERVFAIVVCCRSLNIIRDSSVDANVAKLWWEAAATAMAKNQGDTWREIVLLIKR